LKIIATIYKELLLLLRDPGGMALIFLMPLALVIVMALVQDAPFRDYQEIQLDVVLVDQDADSLSANIKKAFGASRNVNLVLLTDTVEAMERVRSGEFKAAIIIPKDASGRLRKKTQQMITNVFSNFGLGSGELDTTKLPTINVTILFDPAIKANYQQTLAGIIEKIMASVQTKWVLEELQNELQDGNTSAEKIDIDLSQVFQINRRYAGEAINDGVMLNSVQHNVPAWTMFAMFFILYPLAGNFIKEREEGSMLRLRLISGSQFPVIAGKFSFYFTVCLFQFLMMIAVGVFVMPLLGLNRLVLGDQAGLILLTASCVAMAATGYGMLIAVYFRTAQQALSFGSISVVILSAIGGVWVPVYVMPGILQTLSLFSPMSWGLESFNDLFLRQASLLTVMPNLVRLAGFALITGSASVFIHKARTVV
jgi:ABC-2 type transport system permease protein